MTEHESTVKEVKNLVVSLSAYGLTLITAFALVAYVSYLNRVNKLESRVFAQAEWTTETNAVIARKDMGFFSNGYELNVKVKNQGVDLYVSPEEYLAAQTGQKTCIRYKLFKGNVKGAHLCGQSTGEK